MVDVAGNGVEGSDDDGGRSTAGTPLPGAAFGCAPLAGSTTGPDDT
jgi:hypothetical protein